jgi:geranylgeranyl pyrophosphate synthase
LKVFDEGNKALYENEKRAFSALRHQRGMVRYLGEYNHKEIRPSSNSEQQQAAGRREEKITPTDNILLEYGKCDLDELFIERKPPILPTEIVAFWKKLFYVANTVECIHNLNMDSDGMVKEYLG